MGLFSRDNRNEKIDFDRLRKDLINKYGAQMAAFNGDLGFLDMCNVRNAPEHQLLEMAKREGFDLSKYKR